MSNRLCVRVNDELVLDAGTWEEREGPAGPECLVRPPGTTLFRQLLAWLRAQPDPPAPLRGTVLGREGAAAAALCLRYGTYLAVLLDPARPVWSAARDPEGRTSRISDAEMARIAIEASAALAEWIDLYRAEDGGDGYLRLVDRAVAWLPLPCRRAKFQVTGLVALSQASYAAALVQASDPGRVAQARADAARHPSRLLANAIVNTAWRNGPVEDIHAGWDRGQPLDGRRATPAEERTLLRFASDRLAVGMHACLCLRQDDSGRTWAEQVLPYGLAHLMGITPTGWSLTEVSRDVVVTRA